MSYCVNCGVHLKDEANECPLCQTHVFNPTIKKTVDVDSATKKLSEEAHQNSFDKNLWIKLVSITLFTPGVLTVLINWVFQHELTWSLYVFASLILVWVWLISPFLFSRARFLKLVPINTISMLIFLYWIEMFSNTFGWFLPIALPITLAFFTLITFVFLLIAKKKIKELQIPAIILISMGVFSVIINGAINLFHNRAFRVDWSLLVITACFAIAMVALVLQQRRWIVEELKHWFRI